jgi:putative addiction module CopG family antidote
MARRTVSLSADFENLVVSQVNSGRFATASEVVRAALRLLAQQQRDLPRRLSSDNQAKPAIR